MSGMTGQNEAGTDECTPLSPSLPFPQTHSPLLALIPLCRAATTGHYYSLLKGVCIGFAVPFLPLFFFRSQVFSKRCVSIFSLSHISLSHRLDH